MDKVKARLIELLPGIHKNWKDSFYIPVRNGAGKDAYGEAEDYVDENPDLTPITLADVLRAMIKKNGGVMNDDDLVEVVARFDLALDFDNQTPETRSFIGSLIGVTE